MSGPLFLPLRSQYFLDFAAGRKDTEWRRWGARYNERTLTRGRLVTISKGYSGPRLVGVIVDYELRSSDQVDGALTIFQPGETLVGIRIKLRRRATARR